uniref:PPPDE domain-containing protein n=1 Tax=Oryza nivara TaxID=4536 RepID=A0A0E0GFH4_ORYNI
MRVLPASWSSAASSSASASKDRLNSPTPAPPPPAPPPPAPKSSSSSSAELYLNIYDISPINHYLYWFGLGIFHSGIEVHGMEYGFGAHEYPTSGVFQVEPKSCPGFIFRRSVCVGSTDMSRSEVRSFIEDLAEDYHGDTYHLIAKNCNHFTADICKRLTGKPIPGWVNRLARLGSFCNCVLPESIKVSAVKDVTDPPEFPDDDMESNASIVDGSDADDLDHLLITPSSDVVSSKDKILTPGRDSL